MAREFERLLDECLAQLNNGEADLETILAQHPEDAELLRLLLTTALRVEHASHPTPSPVAKSVGKQKLMMAVAHRRQEREQHRTREAMGRVMAWLGQLVEPAYPMRRLAFSIATIVLMFALSGLGVSRVAARSLPDSPLYPIKLATENVQLVLAPSPSERARLHIAFAERRVEETRALAESGRDVDQVVVAMILQNKQAFSAIAQIPTKERAPYLADLAEVTRTERRALSELKKHLSPDSQRVVSDAIAFSAEDQARAEEARSNPALVQLIPTTLPPMETRTPTSAAPKRLMPAPTETRASAPVVVEPEKPDRPTAAPTAAPTATPVPPPTQAEKPTRVAAPAKPTSAPVEPTQVQATQPDVSEPARPDSDDDEPAAPPTSVAGHATMAPTVVTQPQNTPVPPDFGEPISTPVPLP